MSPWASVIFYVADVFFASLVVFGLNFIAQSHPDKISTLQLSYSGLIFFVVAGIAFELFKTRYDRDKFAEHIRRLNTCDPDSKAVVEFLLLNHSDNFIDKVPSDILRAEIKKELLELKSKAQEWHSHRIETSEKNWRSLDLRLLNEAKETVHATSCGHMNDFWDTEAGKVYLIRNCERQQSRVQITRIFIFTEEEEKNPALMAKLERVIKIHLDSKIKVGIRRVSSPEPINPADHKDFAIFDGRIVSYTVNKNMTSLHWDEEARAIWRTRFQTLLDDSIPPEECFPKLRGGDGGIDRPKSPR